MTPQKHPIEDLDFGILGIATYKGCILSKVGKEYYIFNQRCDTPEEVDEAISQAGKWLEGSIKVVNNGSINCQNDKP